MPSRIETLHPVSFNARLLPPIETILSECGSSRAKRLVSPSTRPTTTRCCGLSRRAAVGMSSGAVHAKRCDSATETRQLVEGKPRVVDQFAGAANSPGRLTGGNPRIRRRQHRTPWNSTYQESTSDSFLPAQLLRLLRTKTPPWLYFRRVKTAFFDFFGITGPCGEDYPTRSLANPPPRRASDGPQFSFMKIGMSAAAFSWFGSLAKPS